MYKIFFTILGLILSFVGNGAELEKFELRRSAAIAIPAAQSKKYKKTALDISPTKTVIVSDEEGDLFVTTPSSTPTYFGGFLHKYYVHINANESPK